MSGELDWVSNRGVSPVIGMILMVAIVVLLASSASIMFLGIGDRVDDLNDVTTNVDTECPGYSTVDYGGDVEAIQDRVQNDPCALWLEAGQVKTNDAGEVTQWTDQGNHKFHATAPSGREPELVESHGAFDDPYVSFDGSDPNDGEYLKLNRDVEDFDLNEDTGMVVVAVMRVDSFNRGGTWTIGEAGADGREFSMRTCSDLAVDGCQHADPAGHWRAQHWGSADIDFQSDETTSEWFVLTHHYNGDEVIVRVNGQEVARDSVSLDLSDDRDIQLARWERTDGDPDWYFHGDMAEAMFFDHTMDQSDITSVEDYMMDRFNINAA